MILSLIIYFEREREGGKEGGREGGREREREKTQVGEGQRARRRQDPKQSPYSQHRAR